MSNSEGLIQKSAPLNTGKLINAYYLEIEYLLDRVEGANTHYQTLGVDRSASSDEVITAYQKTVTVLHPSYHKVRAAVPDEMLIRIDKAFTRLSQAFSVLTNSKERAQYDLQQRTPNSFSTVPFNIRNPQAETPNSNDQQENGNASQFNYVNAEAVQINVAPGLLPAFTKSAGQDSSTERRRCERFRLSVPVLVAGYECTGEKWQEVAKTIDVSRIGVGLQIRRRVKHSLVVHITLPLPTKLRCHGFSEAGYNIYAIVRRVEPVIDGMRIIGLEFIGATPPADYLSKPWATFRTQRWNGPERRLEAREDRAEPVTVEYLDQSMQPIARATGVTENISLGGARICIKTVPAEFDFVRISNPTLRFNSIGLVRNQWTGTDGLGRLCLEFVDQRWPI